MKNALPQLDRRLATATATLPPTMVLICLCVGAAAYMFYAVTLIMDRGLAEVRRHTGQTLTLQVGTSRLIQLHKPKTSQHCC